MNDASQLNYFRSKQVYQPEKYLTSCTTVHHQERRYTLDHPRLFHQKHLQYDFAACIEIHEVGQHLLLAHNQPLSNMPLQLFPFREYGVVLRPPLKRWQVRTRVKSHPIVRAPLQAFNASISGAWLHLGNRSICPSRLILPDHDVPGFYAVFSRFIIFRQCP